ncbi:hypothetical protein AR689_20950 [Arthrobacter sp. EpRS71]|nr:hypothetical protein AR689_20950 [Arthrobacter sp. EpRS71]
MIKATVMTDARSHDIGEPKIKETSVTAGQTEASVRLWGRDGEATGIWEVTPGTFKSTRPGFDEVCYILSGEGTITEPDGTSFELRPGTLFVTPSGWEASWTVRETLRKVWFTSQLPA